MLKWFAVVTVLCCAVTCKAEISDASTTGFTVSQRSAIDAAPSDVWFALTQDVKDWWNPSLTVSGDSQWLRFDLRPGGCLCERFDESNGLEHLRVTGVRAPHFLRLNGGLGPLGLMGINGNMTIELSAQNEGTQVELIYAVGGYHADGVNAFAEPVDAVLADVLQRLKAYVESAHAE